MHKSIRKKNSMTISPNLSTNWISDFFLPHFPGCKKESLAHLFIRSRILCTHIRQNPQTLPKPSLYLHYFQLLTHIWELSRLPHAKKALNPSDIFAPAAHSIKIPDLILRPINLSSRLLRPHSVGRRHRSRPTFSPFLPMRCNNDNFVSSDIAVAPRIYHNELEKTFQWNPE